jgi:membrane protein DedA with SNARE-associated domain
MSAEASGPLPSRTEERRRRRRLAFALGPIAITSLASITGTALAPTLLVSAPLALIALNPVTRHLVLASGDLSTGSFFAVALARLFLPDPFYYLIGRWYGADAVDWIERRAGGAGQLVRFVERAFSRAGYVVLFIAPMGLICVLAGAARIRPVWFVLIDLAGTLTAITLVRLFGDVFATPLAQVRDFVAANVIMLTVLSASVALGSEAVRRWRARRGS